MKNFKTLSIFIALAMSCLIVNAQVGFYKGGKFFTPLKSPYAYDYFAVPRQFSPPSDTIYSKTGLAFIGTRGFVGNDTFWTEIKATATVVLDSLRRANYFAIKNGGDSVIIDRATESLAGALAAVDQVNLNRIERRDDFASVRNIGTDKLNTNIDYVFMGRRFRYDPFDGTSADDSAMTIVTFDGARFKQVIEGEIHPEWWGAVGDGTTNDAAAMNKMYRWIEGDGRRTYSVVHEHTRYLINDTVFLPRGKTGEFVRVNISGYGVTYVTTKTGGVVLYRLPADHNEAVNAVGNYISSYTFTIKGISFLGNTSAGQVAIKAAALYSSEISDCMFTAFDTAMILPFWLNGTITNNLFTNNLSVAMKFCSGANYWTGGSTSNSAFNANHITKNRSFNRSGSRAALEMWAGDGNVIDGLISEGKNPFYDIYINSQASSVVNGNIIKNIWFESTGGTYALNTCMYIRSPSTFIETFQNDYADTLIDISDGLSSQLIKFSDITYMTGAIFNGGGKSLAGVLITIEKTRDDFIDQFFDTSRWVGRVVPGGITAIRGVGIKSTGSITITPNTNTPTANKSARIEGNLAISNDNVFYIGRVGSSNVRPRSVYAGTGGFIADKASTSTGFTFGDATGTSQGLKSINDSVLYMYSTGLVIMPGGTTAQRPTATANAKGLRYNTTIGRFEYTNGASWFSVMNNPFTTTGDLMYWNGTAETRIGIGSALQSFRVNASGTGYEFYTPSAGGGSSSLQITID